MKYLIVVAHPDDEILGAGATISKLSREGNEVYTCIMTSTSHTRFDDLVRKIDESNKIVGIKRTFLGGDFEAEKLKDESHQDLMELVEGAIKAVEPDVIITHHPNDLHSDHYITSKICQEASRLSQRQICSINKLKGLYYFEVQSSTDWALNNAYGKFEPDTFVEVEQEDVDKKIKALEIYDGVVRSYPFPRSERAINALTDYRGTQCGFEKAEAFETAFRIGV